MPQDFGWPVQDGAADSPATAEANVENFLFNFAEPQCGHLVPFQLLDRTSTSLSCSQLSQWNS
jgi:hypothetical protein